MRPLCAELHTAQICHDDGSLSILPSRGSERHGPKRTSGLSLPPSPLVMFSRRIDELPGELALQIWEQNHAGGDKSALDARR
ncbi:hypothetical protein RRG08_013247 [Elysia crispata]|uniref:Uncharacterized protein n=1 Tax=Elysia crispata TaxID=231223 RepID=A0AAE0Z5R5_9GAST|nr:hypothetical protein RRG08_013247 [Elysia crispata]